MPLNLNQIADLLRPIVREQEKKRIAQDQEPAQEEEAGGEGNDEKAL